MSTFAFGICVSNSVGDFASFAHDLKRYVLSSDSEFYIELGGNANSYWRYRKDSKLAGLAFEITDSVVANTAERTFQLNDEDFLFTKLEEGPLSKRLARIQRLMKYMLQSECIQEILLYILVDYGVPDCLDITISCHSDCVATVLWDYCTQNNPGNFALRILR